MRVSGKEQSESRITLSRGLRRRHRQGPEGTAKAWGLSATAVAAPIQYPSGSPPQSPFSGVHTHAVSSLMGSPTDSRNHTSFRGQITDDRAFLRGPLSSPTHGLRLPRWEHRGSGDRGAWRLSGKGEHLRLPGTGEHGGSRGKASTCGSRGQGSTWGSRGKASTEAPGDRGAPAAPRER